MKYLEWKGADDAGYFSYYDKEAGENKQIKLDEFIVKGVSYTVRGWDDESKSPIYSNDITNFNDEEFDVRCKSGSLFKGRYDKGEVAKLGAKLNIKISIIHGGEEMAMYLKGMNYFNFSNLLKDVDTSKTKIKVDGASDEKAGAVKFKAPIFDTGSAIKADEISVEEVPF